MTEKLTDHENADQETLELKVIHDTVESVQQGKQIEKKSLTPMTDEEKKKFTKMLDQIDKTPIIKLDLNKNPNTEKPLGYKEVKGENGEIKLYDRSRSLLEGEQKKN